MKPKKSDIPPARIEEFVHNGSPASEIADFFGVSESSIRRWFPEELKKARSVRRMYLRKMQWKSAEGGSVPMQIFLGKQELGQGEAPPPQTDTRIIVRRLVDRTPGSGQVSPEGRSGSEDSGLLLASADATPKEPLPPTLREESR